MEIPISDIKNLGNSILTALHINISHGIKIFIAIFVFLAIVVLFVAAVFVACKILKDPFLLLIKTSIKLIKKLYYLFLNLPWIAAIIDYKKTKKENDALILENDKLRQNSEAFESLKGKYLKESLDYLQKLKMLEADMNDLKKQFEEKDNEIKRRDRVKKETFQKYAGLKNEKNGHSVTLSNMMNERFKRDEQIDKEILDLLENYLKYA